MTTTDELYELLPAIYRIRDADQGLVLRGLLEILAGQADALDRDIAGLYDNWFIETCAPWVVPYIGDLMRVRGLISTGRVPAGTLSVLGKAFSQRAYVANTMRFRRRKGTPAVLEELAYAVTGWRTRVAEFFQLLSTTQYLNHVRPFNVRTPDLRRTDVLELEGGPFDTIAHTAEVRPVDPPLAPDGRAPVDRGRYNIPNLGLYVWRLESFPVTKGTPRLVTPAADAGYTFSPLGLDGPLFNSPHTEPGITQLAQEVDVPGPLRRRALYDELEAHRQAVVDDPEAEPVPGFLLATDSPAFQVFLQTPSDTEPKGVPADEVLICDLSAWGRPSSDRSYTRAADGVQVTSTITAVVDPVLGRLTFASNFVPDRVQVSFGYGFSGNLGGGPYDRRDGVALWLDPGRVTWALGVTEDAPGGDPLLVPDLRSAVAQWNAFVAAHGSVTGVIAVMDSGTYEGDLTGPTFGIDVPEGCRLAIVAADWPAVTDPIHGGAPQRTPGVISPEAKLRPHVEGAASVRGSAPGASTTPGELILQGLLVEGALSVLAGNLGRLRLIDCTLVPAEGGLSVNPSVQKGQQNAHLEIAVDRSICGPISLPDTVHRLHVQAGIVDAGSGAAIAAPGADADIQRSTVFGSSHVRTAIAGNSIFTGPLTADLLQEGCVRFSSLAAGSSTPRRFRCQPDLALPGITDPAVAARIQAEMIPAFTSSRYGDAAYAQLALTCSGGIRTGAEDGSEMGVFSSLHQPQREANLRASLDEYLRFGLEAGVFFVT